MMDWTGKNRKKLRQALMSGFRNYNALKIFVSNNFTFRLDEIVSSQGTTADFAEALIDYFEERGKTSQLIVAVNKDRSDNKEVKDLIKLCKLDPDFFDELCKLDPVSFTFLPGSSEAVIPGRELDYSSSTDNELEISHLIVALFSENDGKKFRVQTEFSSASSLTMKSEKIDEINEALKSENLSESEYMNYVDRCWNYLKNFFNDQDLRLELVVKLFLPIELLPNSVYKLCEHNNNDLLHRCIIVFGCSDRYNPMIGRARELRQELKESGWQRFQQDIQRATNSKLINLKWLDSQQAKQESFRKYSGFCCYGNWLKPQPKHLHNWDRLIESGIPLALWQLHRPQDQTFQALTDRDYFEFLKYIPIVREEQYLNGFDYLGVFYEDPDHVPSILTEAVQYYQSF